MNEQIPHLVELGVTAVEILPVFEYDELEFQRSPNPRVRALSCPCAIAQCNRSAGEISWGQQPSAGV